MIHALVVFYSRTGTTRKIAHLVADQLESDREEIVDRRHRAGLLGFLRSGMEATLEREAQIAPARLLPADYDLVVIGTPVWSAGMSSAVRAYLRKHRGEFKSVAFFCTKGGRGGAKAFRQMAAAAGQDPIAVLELDSGQIRSRRHIAMIELFVRRVRWAAPTVAS